MNLLKITNYIRYIIAVLILFSMFYSYNFKIDSIQSRIDKKLPIKISKKSINLEIKKIKIIDTKDNIVNSRVDTKVSLNKFKKIGKFLKAKPLNLTVTSQAIPQLDGYYLRFKVLSLKIDRLFKIKHLKGTLQKAFKKIKIPIKKLKATSWLIRVKDFKFKNSDTLMVKIGLSKIVGSLLIFALLLREIGLLLIVMYQKFISPKKGYKCAKGVLHNSGTCSSITKEAFKKYGFIAGIKAYFKTTKECKKAYKTLQKRDSSCMVFIDTLSCGANVCGGFASASSASVATEATGGVCGSALGACDISAPCSVASC